MLFAHFLCCDWSKFDRWVHAENLCGILNLVFFHRSSWQSFVSTCDVFNCLFPLHVQNEIQLLSGVFCYSFLVCLLGFWLRNTSNRFRMASFSFFNLILVFVNENRCLCICFTELYFFYWLLVFSLVILIAVLFVFSRSVNVACRSIQNAARIKRFWRLHKDKSSKWKITIINYLSCWSVSRLMFIQTGPQLALQKWEAAGHI